MSIRLRLTLIYSVILAIILLIFSLSLYVSQTKAIRGDFERKLANTAQRFLALQRPPDQFAAPIPFPPPREGGAEQPRSGTDRPLLPQPLRSQDTIPDTGDNPQDTNEPVIVELPPSSPAGEVFIIQVFDMEGTVVQHTANLDEENALPLNATGLEHARQGLIWSEIAIINDERYMIFSQPFPRPGREDRIVQVSGSFESRYESMEHLKGMLIIGNVVMIALTAGLAWFLASVSLLPIHRITRTAQEIGSKRDFSRRVEYRGPNDEVGQLAHTFNAMLKELQSSYQKVEQSLESQRRFVADASHELRTPMTTIRGNLDLLQREPPIDDEDRADVLTDMVEETERLMRMVSNLLTLARADVGRALHLEPVDATAVVQAICQKIRLVNPHRVIAVEGNTVAMVTADRDALKQIILVLVDNALKHTLADATITLTLTLAPDTVAIAVRDTGQGIEPAILPHIFNRFYRGNPGQSGGGSGLGLAIAKELVEAMGGTIGVESYIGQGSVFTVALPSA